MKIATFNVLHFMNYLTKEIDFRVFSDEIQSLGADIVGLNEVRGKGFIKGYTDQTGKISSLTGMNSYFGKAISVRGLAPYGNALLSKGEIENAETIKIPDPEKKTGDKMYEPRCIIKAKCSGYNIFVTHMGLNSDERENAVKKLLEIAPDEKCIILGDFNCTPDSEEIKPLFQRFCCSDINDLTFPSEAPNIKIDYIFFSKDIKIKSCGTSRNIVSDHLAQWIEIEEN